jgi:trehalose utilization protein
MLLSLLAAAGLLAVNAADAAPKKQSSRLRVLCWSEQTEPREIYPAGISGALADHLNKQKEFEATTAQLSDPEAGLSEETLMKTDVLIWFGHRKHNEVPDEIVQRVVRHIRERGLGFIALHSAHFSKPLKAALQATGAWSSYRNWGQSEQVWVVAPDHPIAKGIKDFTLPKTEIYTEPFEVPAPEAVILEGTWPTGHRSRECLVWTLGKGRFVYIRPGHEEYPIFFMPEMQRLVANAVSWAGKRTHALAKLTRREAGPKATATGPLPSRPPATTPPER